MAAARRKGHDHRRMTKAVRLVRRLLGVALVPARRSPARCLSLLVVPTLLGGCLVASDPDFRGQDECVPFFLAHEAEPSTSEAHRRPESADDPEEFRASVPLRSCALTTDYVAHVFIDDDLRVIKKIPPSGGELRDVSVLVDIAKEAETPGCHRAELYVSSNFADFKTPERAGDVAKISWFFFNVPDALVSNCGNVP